MGFLATNSIKSQAGGFPQHTLSEHLLRLRSNFFQWWPIVSEDTNLDEEDKKVPQIQIGPRTITRFETARVLGARALQISMGAPVLADPDEEEGADLSDPLLISQKEIEAGLLPIMIRRFLPDGRYQDIPLRWLLHPKKASISTT